MSGVCAWCKGSEPPMTPVGFVEQATSAGAYILACRTCRETRRLMPLAEHPEGTDGQPRSYPAPGGQRPTP